MQQFFLERYMIDVMSCDMLLIEIIYFESLVIIVSEISNLENY